MVDFAVPANQRVKLKESKKRNKYVNLDSELWNKKVMVIWTIIDVLCKSRKDWYSDWMIWK